MGRKGYRAEKIRKASEFDTTQLIGRLYPPNSGIGNYAWTIEAIREARDQQMAGQFMLAARLAESMRTDDALFVAYNNRLDPLKCIGVEIVTAGPSPAAKRIAREAEGLFGTDGIGVRTATITTINGCLANHGIAVGAVTLTARPDGSRIDTELEYWPIEWVYWDAYRRTLMTRTHNGPNIPITHGDGRWVVFSKHSFEPWKQDAAVLPAGVVWGRHAFAGRDWSRGATTHGNAKVVGEFPAGIPLQGEDGALTQEAAAFLALLQAIASVDTPVGIRPAGSKTDYIVNNSTAWQVWSELMLNAEKAAARIYLGTDGTLGASGGAPGVDITALFGVATTKIQGDREAIERGLREGVIEPWCALNFGTSALAPSRQYLLPDADENAEREAYDKRRIAFDGAIKRLKENGFELSQEVVSTLAARYDIEAPMLPSEAKRAPTVTLAPTDIAKVVTVNEARASAGLGPLLLTGGVADPKGALTVSAFDAANGATTGGAPPGNGGAALTFLAGTYDESKHPRADNGEFGSGGGGAPHPHPTHSEHHLANFIHHDNAAKAHTAKAHELNGHAIEHGSESAYHQARAHAATAVHHAVAAKEAGAHHSAAAAHEDAATVHAAGYDPKEIEKKAALFGEKTQHILADPKHIDNENRTLIEDIGHDLRPLYDFESNEHRLTPKAAKRAVTKHNARVAAAAKANPDIAHELEAMRV